MLGRLSRFVVTHKKWVALFWLGVTVAGMATASTTVNRLSTQFSTPGREGSDAAQQIVQRYGTGGFEPPLTYVVTVPQGTTVDQVRSQLADLDRRIVETTADASGRPTVRLASFASTGDAVFVSHDRRTTYGLIYTPASKGFSVSAQEDRLRPLVNGATIGGTAVRLTGYGELESGTGGGGNGPGVLAEALIGGVGALLVLAFVFASFLALVPLMVAITSILGTFLLILGVTAFADVSFIVQFLVALIGLGIAVDYSLLIVTRWREERANGLDNEAAIHRSMETAGSAVVFSGTTVGIGLFTLVVLPVPFLRSVGYGGLLIPVVSVAVAMTLLPAILASFGPWIDRPRIRKEAHASRGWVAWARLMVRRRWLAAMFAVLILALLGVQAERLTVGSPVADALAQSGPAKQGLEMLERSGIPVAAMAPYEIVVNRGDPSAVAAAARTVPDIYGAVAPGGAAWSRGGVSLVDAVSTLSADTPQGRDQVAALRTAVDRAAGDVKVSGANAISADFVSAIYGNFPIMLAIVLVATFILLARAFRSILLPLKAVILNLISVAAAYGVLTLVWQDGHGSSQLFGIQATGAIDEWIPLFVFAFLFGLSMDYEVFILARMREEYDATGNTDLAIVRAVGRTGRLVTCAALILFLAFLVLGSGPETTIKIFATGLAAGILLDATVVRALFVPAVVSLLGRWNWWLPRLPARLILTHPSEPVPETRREILAQEA